MERFNKNKNFHSEKLRDTIPRKTETKPKEVQINNINKKEDVITGTVTILKINSTMIQMNVAIKLKNLDKICIFSRKM